MNVINTITVEGNLVADPEIRIVPSGAAAVSVRIASTQRRFDKTTNEWVDGDTLFIGANLWRQHGENVAESLKKGMRVIITGRLKSRSFETREGEKRTAFEIDADVVAPVLRTATATVTKATRDKGAAGDDVWSTPSDQSAQAPF